MAIANTVATWASIAVVVIGGGIWVGSVSAELSNTKVSTENNTVQIDKLRNEGPPAIARLEAQMTSIQGDVIDIKSSQKDLLNELRKK